MPKRNIILVVLGTFILTVALVYINFFQKRASKIPQIPIGKIQEPTKEAVDYPRLSTVAANLEVPWALAFLPDGNLLVTERPGRVKIVNKDGNLNPKPILEIPVVQKIQGEGGLHGITIHPAFEKNHFVYLYYTYENQGNRSLNRVERYVFRQEKLTEDKIIVNEIPGALFHDGGRIKFGPDDFLYITTGDAQNPSLSQNINSPAGKILRVTDEGRPAPNNPFGNEILSYGHRNPQGITWDSKGRLWETEHGQTATDELNLIKNGLNYGWPDIRGDQKKDGLESPILHSGSNTWAPGGAAYLPAGEAGLNGSVFFAGLRGQTLYEAVLENGEVREIKEHLKGELGRIRDVIVGPENLLYITTSNRDGRGVPDNDDDKIIRVNPEKL